MSTMISHERPLATLIDTMAATGRFTAIIAALTAAGMGRSLRLQGPYTLFAPSDWAFEKLPKNLMAGLEREPRQLEQLLRGHLVAGSYRERDLIPFTRLPNLAGRSIRLSLGENYGDVYANGIAIVTSDILAGNGVVHEIDEVMFSD